jgi:hypothetical protein
VKMPEICRRKPRLARTGLLTRLAIDEDAALPKFDRALLIARLVLYAGFSFHFEFLGVLP